MTTALLVIDMQNGVVASAHDRDGVIRRIGALVGSARQRSVPVVWVQHADGELIRDSEAWQLVDGLQPEDDEAVVHKGYNDAFEDTTLAEVLQARNVRSLVVTGAQTEWCIRATLHGAIARGYDATLVADAHTTGDFSEKIPATSIIELTNHYWRWHSAPGRTAGVVESTEVTW